MKSSDIGNRGEYIAQKYLIQKGYKIVDLNFFFETAKKKKIGEVDIIAKKGDIYYFVEVKASLAFCENNPYFSLDRRVDYKKGKRIILTARHWFARENIADKKCQIDIIGVLIFPDKFEIIHLENVFEDDEF